MCIINFNKARWWGGAHKELLETYITFARQGVDVELFFWRGLTDQCTSRISRRDGFHRVEDELVFFNPENGKFINCPSCHWGVENTLARIQFCK